jgi:hypothetical protein
VIDSRDFLAAKRRAETEVLLPAGPKIAFRADNRKVPQIAFKPDWTRHAKAAPFKRNDQMLDVWTFCRSASLSSRAPASRRTLPTRPRSSASPSGSSARAARERRCSSAIPETRKAAIHRKPKFGLPQLSAIS